MLRSADNRWLATLALCLGILLNALVCSYHHASHVGLELLLGPGAFCQTDDGDAPAGGLPASDEASQPFNCPLCNPATLALALLFCLSWLLRRRGPDAVRLPRERRCKAPPRHCWPPLNPRAP
ncbi:DUF2946 domain-containing protein [Pseudomonas sp. A-1]|uniref:DUF2946 family protein n=1 Tax=Pseudomonas sp. A-1 TaxID=1821274 RepID=UPI0010A61921|nr:DUF2946 family protein [Pseudomonas sp. A-1]THG77602.1 DUF2946 domain-containing protein [Pseudomonas sp. A-1]